MFLMDFAVLSVIALIILGFGLMFKRKFPMYIGGIFLVILALMIGGNTLQYCNGYNFNETYNYSYLPASNLTANVTMQHTEACNPDNMDWQLNTGIFVFYLFLGLGAFLHNPN